MLFSNPSLNSSIWLARGFVSFVFCAAGIMELTMPIDDLAKFMPWVQDHPVWFTRSLGIVDIAGAIGIALPEFVRKAPQLIKYAAFGCASKQVVAIIFHLSQDHQYIVPLNIVLLILSLFVLRSRIVTQRISAA